jgi:phage recombination protein Bet
MTKLPQNPAEVGSDPIEVSSIAIVESSPLAPVNASPPSLNASQIELIKNTICRDASDDELALFLQICRRTGLDPFVKQLYSIQRWDKKAQRNIHQTQVSIDGMRIVALRSGEYRGQTQPQWCGEDGIWRDAWLRDEPPAAARVGIHRAGFVEPLYAVATMRSYGQRDKDGMLVAMWRNIPDVMLSKCAEALALRKAFPNDLSGLYTGEEMAQSSNVTITDISSSRQSSMDILKDLKARGMTSEAIKVIALGKTGKDSPRTMTDSELELVANECNSQFNP